MINITDKKARRRYQRDMDRHMTAIESIFAKDIKPILKSQFYAAAKIVHQGNIDSAVDKTKGKLKSVFNINYKRIASSFSKKVYDAAEKAKLKSIAPEYIKEPIDEFWQEMNLWATIQMAEKVVKIQDTTKRNIASIIAKGMEAEETNREIAKRLTQISDKISMRRALVIARNETHTVAVKSVDTAIKTLKIEMEKEWVSARDDRTRTRTRGDKFEHFNSWPNGPDGERVKQDGVFKGTGESLEYPGDPKGSAANTILCRCVVLYYTVRKPIQKPEQQPVPASSAPMNSIGNLSNCLIGQKEIIHILEMKKKPSPCMDFTRSKGKWFLHGKEITEKETITRFNNMKLPPSWRRVTVSTDPTAKVQAVGMDKAGRWQYRYSAEHIAKAARKKFDRVKLFSQEMPIIEKGINKGIIKNDQKAFLLRLESRTAIRAGSTKDFRAKKKAYGLTTLQHEHVIIDGDKIILDFVAKEGIPAHYELKDRILAKWLKERKAKTKTGEMLFPDISASKLNDYIKQLANGKKFTIKDFRTYHGTRIAYEELKQYAGQTLSAADKKRIIKEVSEKASSFLKNTPSMARKSYIDPMVWDFIGGI